MKKKNRPQFIVGVLSFLILVACGLFDVKDLIGSEKKLQRENQATLQAVYAQETLQSQNATIAAQSYLKLPQVAVASHTCAPHGDTPNAYDCTFNLTFTVEYSTTTSAHIQCFSSSHESEKVAVSAGASRLEIPLVKTSLYFAPGTGVNAFCQLRNQADDTWLAEGFFVGTGPYDDAFPLSVP